MTTVLVALAFAAGAAADSDPTFRVLTYNIHHGEGTDGRVDLERIASVIREAHPDIVCLQEVDRNLARTQRLDMPETLARLLGMPVVFGPNLETDGGQYGNATLTRFPVTFHEVIPLPVPEGDEPRGCLRTTIEVHGRPVDVYNAHFGLTAAQRKDQASALAARLGPGPAVLAGDLNAHADSAVLQILGGPLRDAVPETPRPDRIDYVLATPDIVVLRSRVVSAPPAEVASDHLPYAADLSLGATPKGAEAKGIYDADDERVDEAVGED